MNDALGIPADLKKPPVRPRQEIFCESGYEVIVIGPQVWGKARTVIEAKANARKEVSRMDRKKVRFVGFLVPKGSYVNGLGGINRPNDEKEVYDLGEV
jgi:hypothetical protein